MEQGPKIEYTAPKEAETEKPEKPLEKSPGKTPEEPAEESELNPAQASEEAALAMMVEAKAEFPPEIQALIEKMKNGLNFLPEERKQFFKARGMWWKEKFGMPFEQRLLPKKEEVTVEYYKKRYLMLKLHTDLRNLDKGRAAERFKEKDRRVLYYDEDSGRHFVLGKSGPRYLGIGDILSDYAWGIKYVPDKDTPPHIARRLAKRIIINETRRKIEELYDRELSIAKKLLKHQSIADIEKKWGRSDRLQRASRMGFIAEAMCREWLSRVSVNQNLNFVVLRADIIEDKIYKYDFKLRFLQRTRGVAVEENESALRHNLSAIKRLGIQFTIVFREDNVELKKMKIKQAKEKYGKIMPVDEIIFVQVSTHEFTGAFGKWLMEGKPSGGPEQFLSQELKDDLLKKVTAGLVKV